METSSTARHTRALQEDFDKDRTPVTRWLVSGALAVLLAYSLPFLLSLARQGHSLDVAVEDERVYLARVADAFRGGSLGNPYLAEHQDAPRYMPELAERTLALVASLTRLGPLTAVAVSRLAFPVLIYLLLWSLGRRLGLEPRLAMLAGILGPLAPNISWMGSQEGVGMGFLRFFRAVSPAAFVLLLLMALWLLLRAWTSTDLWSALLAGAATGLLLYATPLYFWSFALAGTALQAVFASGRARRVTLIVALTALVVGLPHLFEAWRQSQMPAVRETLARLHLLTPGPGPDPYVTRTLAVAVPLLVAGWIWRRRLGEGGRFLLPFMAAGTLLMIQNVVTYRHLQSYHWIECLIPVWSLAAACLLASEPVRRPFFAALALAVVAGAFTRQALAYRQWEQAARQDPCFWALDVRIPQTLDWLNQHTPANSVVLSAPDIMDLLVLYTHNRVYWAFYAKQYVLPDSEYNARLTSLRSWRPASPTKLPFHADFYLGTGAACLDSGRRQFLYRNEAEATCVLAVSGFN